MKSVAVLVLAGLAGLVAAQDELPSCAKACANKYLASGIGNCGSDPKCICSDKDFLSGIACCLAEPGGCDQADQTSAVAYAAALCSAQGVSVPSAVTCASTFSSAMASTSAVATTTDSAASAATATTATTTAAIASATTTSSTTAAAAATTSSTSSANYAPRESAAVGAGLVGGLVAAFAML